MIIGENFTVAVLDEQGIYLGMTEMSASRFDPSRHVVAEEFGGSCDLPPGRYRWSRERKRFEAVVVNDVNQRLHAIAQARRR